MHEWGDEWFRKYGDQLDAAVSFFQRFLNRYARIPCITKEKYGTLRLEYFYLSQNKVFFQYQKFMFNIATLIAYYKWPDIQREILDEYEFDELLYKRIKKHVNYVCYWTHYS